MPITERLKSFFGISEATAESKEKPLKPFKPIDSPAKILIIDCDQYDDYYYEDFIYFNFQDEVDNNLLDFWFARDLLEASAQIQLNPPDLIICELVLPLCQLIEDQEKIAREIEKVEDNFSRLANLQFEYYARKFGYGFNIFKILDRLNLEYRIPVIFYSTLGNDIKYNKKVEELGALACLEKDFSNNQDLPLKMAIKASLNI